MSFEKFYLAHNISAEEMREKIKEEFRPSKENLDTVTRFMRRMYPTSVPTQEQKDQQDRRRDARRMSGGAEDELRAGAVRRTHRSGPGDTGRKGAL